MFKSLKHGNHLLRIKSNCFRLKQSLTTIYAQQLQTLQQTQLRQEQLMRFSSIFETQMVEMRALIKQVAGSEPEAKGQPSTRKVEDNEITESTLDIDIKGDDVTFNKNTIKGSNIYIKIS